MGTTEESEGLSDGNGGAEALNGDFSLGEDGELEGMSVDDKEMKDPKADDDEWANPLEFGTSLGDPGLFAHCCCGRDHGGACAKANVWSGESGGEEEESEEGEG